MQFLNRLTALTILTIAIAVASSMSYLWYFNAPVYDFVSLNLGIKRDFGVVIVKTNANVPDDLRIEGLKKLHDSGAKSVVQVYPNNGELLRGQEIANRLGDEFENFFLLHAFPIPAQNTDDYIANRVEQNGQVTYLLEPSDDVDGIVRRFDPSRYSDASLLCGECLIAKNGAELLGAEVFIGFPRLGSKIPTLSLEQLNNNWLPTSLFEDKIVILDLAEHPLSDVYRFNLFDPTSESFSYYLASVISTLNSNKLVKPISPLALTLLLVAFGLFLNAFVTNVSLKMAVVSLTFCGLSLIVFNFISMQFLAFFLPPFEFFVLALSYVLSAVIKRNNLVLDDLKVSSGLLELALAETQHKTTRTQAEISAKLYNFYNRTNRVKAIYVFDLRKKKIGSSVLSFNTVSHDLTRESELTKHMARDQFAPKVISLPSLELEDQWYLLIPIGEFDKPLTCIALQLEGEPEKSVDTLIQLSEKYKEDIAGEIKGWLNVESDQGKPVKSSFNRVSGRRRTLAQRNRLYVEQLMTMFGQSRSNYNRLDSIVAIYDIYGNVKSVNRSAELFASKHNLFWFEESLSQTVAQISGQGYEKVQTRLNELLLTGGTHRFSLQNSVKDHIGVISFRDTLVERKRNVTDSSAYLCLEIIDVSNIGSSIRLKDSYVRDLNNQIKQDLSKLTLMVDQLCMLDSDQRKYDYLNEVLDSLNNKVTESAKYLVNFNTIEQSSHYSVSLIEKMDEALQRLEPLFAEKNITLIYNKPKFVSHVLLDYRKLESVFNYLLKLLLSDSQANSNIEVNLNELTTDGGTIITVAVKNAGYGMPLEVLGAQQSESPERMVSQCKTFAKEHGGELDVTTLAGKGMEFSLRLPVLRPFH